MRRWRITTIDPALLEIEQVLDRSHQMAATASAISRHAEQEGWLKDQIDVKRTEVVRPVMCTPCGHVPTACAPCLTGKCTVRCAQCGAPK